MRRWTRIFYFLPAAAHYGFIFFLSSQSSFPIEAPFEAFDKLAHFGLFALLGLFLSFGVFKSTRLSLGIKIALTLVTGAVLGVLDEAHQSAVPLRESDILDALADIAGIALGLIAYGFLTRTIFRRGQKKREDIPFRNS